MSQYTRSVIKLGNSLGLIIPQEIVRDLCIRKGDKVNISDGYISKSTESPRNKKPTLRPDLRESPAQAPADIPEEPKSDDGSQIEDPEPYAEPYEPEPEDIPEPPKIPFTRFFIK